MDRRVKHGHARRNANKLTYNSWRSMLGRCYYPAQAGFSNYGGKGVKVCQRWHTFAFFLADMGERTQGTTLGRYKDRGNYKPSNCAWMTRAEQQANSQRTYPAHCLRGHKRTPENVDSNRNCKECSRIRDAHRKR